MSMITRKVSPALAAGCTVALKPSEETPLTALALAELGRRAGLPDGVLNVVFGDAPAIGAEFAASKAVAKLSFTGSTRIGKLLMRECADTVKKLGLELGGNAPFIVFEDADIEKAAAGIVASGFRNSGQTCICTNRVFCHEAVYERLVAALAERVRALRVGNGLDPDVTQGPLITPAAVDKVEEHVRDALAKGARAVVGGARPAGAAGNFFEPTVLAGADPSMKVYREETFGPVAPVFRFSDDAEAVAMANDTEYGLAAYFYTRDLGRAWEVSEQLEFGMVGVNEVAISTPEAPFGGWKQSGLGLEHSKYALDEFLHKKYVCMGIS